MVLQPHFAPVPPPAFPSSSGAPAASWVVDRVSLQEFLLLCFSCLLAPVAKGPGGLFSLEITTRRRM